MATSSKQLYPLIKHFYPDGSGLFLVDYAPFHKFTEQFDDENDVNEFQSHQILIQMGDF